MGAFFGLDIGSSEIKVMQAEKTSQGFKLEHFGRVVVKEGEETALTVRRAMKQADIKSAVEVNVALPESDVYTRIIETPKLSETELASSIQYEAEQYVPVPLTEVELYHQILEPPEGSGQEKSMKVLLIAVTKERLKKLTSLLDEVGLIPKSLETELFAIHRVLADRRKSQLLIAFGHKTTDLMIVNQGVPLFMHSLPTGGLALTKTMMSEFSLSEDQAERYKQTYGLKDDLLEGRVAKLLMPMIDEVIGQINKAFMFLQQQGGQKAPQQVVITGGGALLPGLSSYLVSKLNLEVVVGDPLSKFVKDEDFNKKITTKINPELTTVTGLALKSWL